MLFTNFSFFFSDSTKDKLSSSVATKKDEIEVDLSTIGEDFDDVAFDNHAYKSMPFPGLGDAARQDEILFSDRSLLSFSKVNNDDDDVVVNVAPQK